MPNKIQPDAKASAQEASDAERIITSDVSIAAPVAGAAPDVTLPSSPGATGLPPNPPRLTGAAAHAAGREPEVVRRGMVPGLFGQLAHMATICTIGIRRSQLTRMAAALSYRTIFGLIPVLVVGLVFTAAFAPREKVSGWLQSLLSFAGLSQIAIIPEPDVGPPSPTDLASPRLDQWIASMVEHVQGLKWEVVGVVGLVTLFYAAISMLVEIEEAFNQIYHAPNGRSWTRRITQYWTLLTLGSLFLVGSFSLPAQLESQVNSVLTYARDVVGYQSPTAGANPEGSTQLANTDQSQGGIPPVAVEGEPKASSAGTDLVSAANPEDVAPAKVIAKKTLTGVLIGAAFSLMVSFVLFLTIFCVVPNTRVQIGAASVGAACSAVLWELAKQGFALYVSYSKGYTNFYGALALLPMFLIWVYLTWLIVLFGLHVAHAMQSYRAAARQGLTQSVMVALGLAADQQGNTLSQSIDPSTFVLAMSVVGERFKTGVTTDPSDVVDRAGLDEAAAVYVLDSLAKAGMLHRVSGGKSSIEGGYVLSRPPDAIALSDVLAVANESTDRVKSPVAMRLLDALSAARTQALAGRSLADALA